MQPYFLPYIGYFQLINYVDEFIFFDNVNFIKKGFINRNNILFHGQAKRFTIPLKGASQNKLINKLEVNDLDLFRNAFFRQLQYSYSAAPNYENVKLLIQNIFYKINTNLISELAEKSIIEVSNYLGIKTQFSKSSDLIKNFPKGFSAEEKILFVLSKKSCNEYINPINGAFLYSNENFKKMNIDLKFFKMTEVIYPQLDSCNFVPDLSIIDILMFMDRGQIFDVFLKKFKLVSNA